MADAFFRMTLHSHIPYCRKAGVWPAGEEWLFEAILETYVPLFALFEDRWNKGLASPVTIGITPVLGDQLDDGYMRDRFDEYLDGLIGAAEGDVTRHKDGRSALARRWTERFRAMRERWRSWDRDMVGKAHELHAAGAIELITSAATHGLLPRLATDEAVRAQIEIGTEYFRRRAGKNPEGFWLPECGYRPGLERALADAGIKFTFLETHAVEKAPLISGDSRPMSTGEPYHLGSGVRALARDAGLGSQVWSRDLGYPGNPYYLEFHTRDDKNGLRYHRITKSEDKELYEPDRIAGIIGEQADHYLEQVRKRMGELSGCLIEKPVITVPFATELYGHWWHEGVDWLAAVFERVDADPAIESAPLSEVLEKTPEPRTITAVESTWGVGGYFKVWEHVEHMWIWPYIHEAEKKLTEAVDKYLPVGDDRQRRLLTQAGRELILLEASDWPFLLYTKQAHEYANQRFHQHHQRLNHIISAMDPEYAGRLHEKELAKWEDDDDPFEWLDPGVWGTRE